MVFSSLSFIFCFLPIFLLLDNVPWLRKIRIYRNYLLIISSLLFYLWGEGKGVFLLLVLAIANLLIGRFLIFIKERNLNKVSDFVLFLGVCANLATLIYYKYLNWFLSQLTELLLFSDISIKNHALPLGISFFTFHAISYLVDIYKNVTPKHQKNEFLAYFFMFPHLVAGPIVRFRDIRDDLHDRKLDFNLFFYGMFRFILGVNKKVLIANSAATVANIAFSSDSSQLGCLFAWVGILAYSVQIYFDFSGYSDMAIGLAAMMGIRFKENFNSPYKANSIKDFWRRWHISLSSWLRDYLYIPLGGSRCSKIINYRNLVCVFILCGLWHGAAYTFLVWGLFHGLLLIFERTKLGIYLEKAPAVLRHSYAFFMILIGWVFFRADTLNDALSYLKEMFSFNTNIETFYYIGNLNLIAIFVGLLIAFFGKNINYEFSQGVFSIPKVRNITVILHLMLFVVSIVYLYAAKTNPFIYFNF